MKRTRHPIPFSGTSVRRSGRSMARGLAALLVLAAGLQVAPAQASVDSLFKSAPSQAEDLRGPFYKDLLASIPDSKINSKSREKAFEGLRLIARDDLPAGSALLNSALQLEPANSYLQFFNAYAYHLMAQRGDTSKYSLAEQGYTLAIKFDRSNWVAHYYLGILHYEQRNYSSAQSEFAEVLLFHENDRAALSMLASASYHAGDPVTTDVCLTQLNGLEPGDPQVLRLLSIVNGALGRFDAARQWLQEYKATGPDAAELSATEDRVRHWSFVHRDRAQTAKPPEARGALASNPGYAAGRLMPVAAAKTEEEEERRVYTPRPANRSPSPGMGGMGGGSGGMQGGGLGAAGQSAGIQALGQATGDKMVLVDVVLMYTEDTLSTAQGVNLLSMLSLQFGGDTSQAAVAKVYAGTKTDATDTFSATTTLTRAISIPALTYSLNIANANTIVDEVLARPTLAALDGMTSRFFSGNSLDAAVVATGANSGGAVQIQKEIGIMLSITPKFLPDGKVLMNVEAQRTFVQPPSNDVVFTYKLNVSKIMVNANVVMKFGETLMLGGLSEKEITQGRDGVPFLQEIPGIQYFFSRKNSSNYQKSVLMLLTPRLPGYTFRPGGAAQADSGDSDGDSNMKEFRARFSDWFAPYPNMASVFHHLDSSSLYREFRTGDVKLEHWDKQATRRDRLRQALGFLFY